MSDPSVVVVIPVHRQPLLLADAVESVLRQMAGFDFRIVLVNDGCPFVETDEVCRSYARRYPERIRYLRLDHRGTSAARNAGADFAREMWPSVQAVQFVNADDRLTVRALQHGFELLQRSENGRGSAPSLQALTGNAVDHAPLVARAALDRGLRFDESITPALADHDFSMQSMREGLQVIASPTLDAQQRRPANHNGHALADHKTSAGATRRKYDSWCTPRLALELEHEESPRFAIYLIDEAKILLTSDPARGERSILSSDLAGQLARMMANPQRDEFPPYFVITSSAFLRSAHHGRFASGLLWLMQYELSRSNVALIGATLTELPGTEYAYDVLPPATIKADAPTLPAILLMRTDKLLDWVKASTGAQFRQLVATPPDDLIRCRELRYTHPDPKREPRADALEGLAVLIDEIKPQLEKQKKICLPPAHGTLKATEDSQEASRRLFGSGPLFPKVLDRSQVHVGFVLPICRFGGADRATMNLGRETRRRGWTPHLFVISSGTAQLLSEFRNTFETITVVEPWELWQPDGLLGLLGTMDVVVNNLSTPTNDVFKLLRRHGIKTICHLHSVIISTNEMPSGQAYEMLRHEKDVDGVIVISKKLRNWCTAWGVPREKLIYAPNAPSFEVSDAFVRTTMEKRLEKSAECPLNILYLGRFDWEKGMDRLLAIHEQTRSAGFPVEWRIVGGRVCGSVTTTDQELEAVQSVMTPPVMTRSGLARLYAWADVVIMVSRFEGVPLTLLEAQRMGCVVLSTNVGAIGEIVESGKTGFLFPNDLDTPALVAQMVDRLRRLQADRAGLMEIARASAALRSQTTWSVNTQSFADFVESLLTPAAN